MRLIDLDPRWCSDFDTPDDEGKQGLTFLCPCCRASRLGVWFDVPICGRPPVSLARDRAARIDCDHPEHQASLHDVHFGRVHWHREGDTFETLTLTPSIDCSHFGHWHGYITAGEIR